MSTTSAKAALIDAMKQLRMRWDQIKYTWQDEAARRFEREVIDPLEQPILQAAKGMEHVGELMSQVRRECGNDATE
jgi:hypothetical protein